MEYIFLRASKFKININKVEEKTRKERKKQGKKEKGRKEITIIRRDWV